MVHSVGHDANLNSSYPSYTGQLPRGSATVPACLTTHASKRRKVEYSEVGSANIHKRVLLALVLITP